MGTYWSRWTIVGVVVAVAVWRFAWPTAQSDTPPGPPPIDVLEALQGRSPQPGASPDLGVENPLTFERVRRLPAVGDMEFHGLIANVVGEFVITDRVQRPDMLLVDWHLEPLNLRLNEFDLGSFVLETAGGEHDEITTDEPPLHVGDRIFLMAEAKTDGRLVQRESHILIRGQDGEAMTAEGNLVTHISSDGLRVARRGLRWDDDGNVVPFQEEGIPMTWEGAVVAAEGVFSAANSRRLPISAFRTGGNP